MKLLINRKRHPGIRGAAFSSYMSIVLFCLFQVEAFEDYKGISCSIIQIGSVIVGARCYSLNFFKRYEQSLFGSDVGTCHAGGNEVAEL